MMDKISIALIFGIVMLVTTSAIIVYDTWLKKDFVVYEMIIIEKEEPKYL